MMSLSCTVGVGEVFAVEQTETPAKQEQPAASDTTGNDNPGEAVPGTPTPNGGTEGQTSGESDTQAPIVPQTDTLQGGTNIAAIYDWEGQYLSQVNLLRGWEIENICHDGDEFYIGVYANNTYTTSYKVKQYKYKTKTKRVWKTKKVYNKKTKKYKKKRVRVKVKYKVRTKKYKWVTKKTTYVVRNNFVYRVNIPEAPEDEEP